MRYPTLNMLVQPLQIFTDSHMANPPPPKFTESFFFLFFLLSPLLSQNVFRANNLPATGPTVSAQVRYEMGFLIFVLYHFFVVAFTS